MLSELINLGLWPDMLSFTSAVMLVSASLLTSGITAAFGLGGGVIMLALLVNFLPIASVIPVHGVIQLGSNSSRTLLMRKHIKWPIFVYFFGGAVIGAYVGGQFVVALQEAVLLGILGLFILYIVWGPKPKNLKLGSLGYVLGGIITTFATMFIGATGPLAMALLPRSKMKKQQISGTHGALLVGQHGLKIMVFGLLGFEYKVWALFLVFMIAAGFIGTYTGRAILQRLPAKYFQKGITLILTVMAFRMLYQAGTALI